MLGSASQTRGCLLDVLQGTAAALAGAMIEHVGTVGAGAVEDVVAFQRHDAPAVAVAEHDALGRDRERPFHQPRRDADPVSSSTLTPVFRQQVQALLVVQADAGAVQDLQAGVVQPLHLVVGQFAKLRGFVGGIIGL